MPLASWKGHGAQPRALKTPGFLGHSAGLWPAECPFREPSGGGGISRKDFLHNPV
ncbi:MAG: hypothetical protein RI973_1729, partial [Bacteroidota bacterium]